MEQRLFSPALAATPTFGPTRPLARAASYANGTGTTTFSVTLALQANCTIACVGIQRNLETDYMFIGTRLAPYKHICNASRLE